MYLVKLVVFCLLYWIFLIRIEVRNKFILDVVFWIKKKCMSFVEIIIGCCRSCMGVIL